MNKVSDLMNKCVHFTGMLHKTCEAGIAYSSFLERGKPLKLPCLSAGGCCDHAQYPTDEEAQAKYDEMMSAGTKALQLVAAVKTHHESTGQSSGSFPCPVCGQPAMYSIASNGHARAACATCEISFNE